KNKLHNIHRGFTHYKYYRAQKDCTVDAAFSFYLILFENLFKPRQLYLQPQNSVLSNLRLAA
ncbi:hypothetical protein, partial [Streptococcus pneumoniae]|uniref:hypothetical protein n=1 Tax=Streptococcus pneumoniae TaxID=1313 RepID=UPI001B7D19A3